MDRDDKGVPVFMTDEKWNLYLNLTDAAIRGYAQVRDVTEGPVVTESWAATERMAQDPLAATAVILCLLEHAAGYDRS